MSTLTQSQDEAVVASVSRRGLLAASGALVLGAFVPLVGPGRARAAEGGAAPPGPPQPNVFIRIAADSSVTVLIKHLDMGQGVATGLTTLVAEELDADWAQMRYEYAPADASKFGNLVLVVQGTGASTSMANSWQQLRRAGAAARAMLVASAAQQWGVPGNEIRIEQGLLRHAATGRQARFGEFAAAAAAQPVPADPVLKAPKDFKLIGSRRTPRLDSVAKTNGSEVFGLDIRLPNQVFAVLARPPSFGATLASLDDSAARRMTGVVDVLRTPLGVAVLATNTWFAIQARNALVLSWDESRAERRSSAQMWTDFEQLAARPGTVAGTRGDADTALASSARRIDAEYRFPFLAHAPLEPLNAIVELREGGATLHTGCQFQTIDQMAVSQELGLKPEQVTVKTYMAGGSFGRRANPAADFVREAAAVAKAQAAGGKPRPVQLVWTRADDLAGGYYRSMFLHRVSAGLDAKGQLQAWRQRIVGHSIAEGTLLAKYMIKNGFDYTSTEGANENAYALPHFHCDVHSPAKTVPILWWRSVGHTHTAYVAETMMDELARAAGQDAVAFRLARLSHNPRLAGVLRLAADKAGWGKPLTQRQGMRRARGVAVHASFGSFTAHVAEVSRARDGTLKVDRLVCAVDCGIPVNPDVITAQMEGGAGFALSALFYDAITFKDGRVEQDNFGSYPLLRLPQMPKVEVHIVPSTEPPTGIGEPGVPSVGPAVANALFAAGGPRVRQLPFSAAGVRV